MKDDDQDVIVAIKPCCNRVVYMAVNVPHVMQKESRKEISDLVLAGCKIEHWPVSAARKASVGCRCAAQEQQ